MRGVRRQGIMLLAAALCGCTVGPNYQAPEPEVPKQWSESGPAGASSATTRPAVVSRWWKQLGDPALDSLVDRAVQSNLDLRVAEARVRESRAQRIVVAADWWPQVNVTGGYSYLGQSENAGPKSEGGPGLRDDIRSTAISTAARTIGSAVTGGGTTGGNFANAFAISQTVANGINSKLGGGSATLSRDQNLFQAGFDANWELDVFGGTRRAVEAAEADIGAAVEDHRNVLVTLVAEVARNYVEVRGFQRRLAIAHENIDAQRETVELTRSLYQAGVTSELDVAQAEAQLATTQSVVPVLETSIKRSIHRLGVLLGQEPGALAEELAKAEPIPATPPDVPIDLPSDLLRRRPDIRRAERELAAATARIGEATAELFPRFSLTGSFGPQSRTMRHFLDGDSLAWSVGPAVSWPIFEGGRIRANIEVRNAQQAQALLQFENTVLAALEDVENALIAYGKEKVRYKSLAEAVAANRRAVNLSTERYRRGIEDFLTVLESERALYQTEDQLIDSERTTVSNLIALYKALGGGWDVEAGTP